MKGLTSPVWTMGMFQMVTWDSFQCMKRTKQNTACDISVRYAECAVPGCEFVARYQNKSNLENHYVTAVISWNWSQRTCRSIDSNAAYRQALREVGICRRLLAFPVCAFIIGDDSQVGGLHCLAHLSLLLSQRRQEVSLWHQVCQVAYSKQ